MAMTQFQYALSVLAKHLNEAAAQAATVQHFGLNFVDPNDPQGKTAKEHLLDTFDKIEATQIFVEDQSGGHFAFVSDTRRALNKMDVLKIQMGYAIEAQQVEPLDEEEEDE